VLKTRGEFEDTLLVITSDHGEAFGEESRIRNGVRISQHSTGLHECLLHVPLIVSHPSQIDGERIDKPVSLTSFPDVVTAATEGNRESFDTGQPIIAANPGIELRKTMPELVQQFCSEDYDLYTGNLHATYDLANESIVKTIRWKTQEVEVLCEDANRSFRTSSRSHTAQDINFESESIAVESSEKISENTLDHLRDLGYA
jgi:arylsulfatase